MDTTENKEKTQGQIHWDLTAPAFSIEYCASFAPLICSISAPDSQHTNYMLAQTYPSRIETVSSLCPCCVRLLCWAVYTCGEFRCLANQSVKFVFWLYPQEHAWHYDAFLCNNHSCHHLMKVWLHSDADFKCSAITTNSEEMQNISSYLHFANSADLWELDTFCPGIYLHEYGLFFLQMHKTSFKCGRTAPG